MKIKIRGIYATALTKLLLDAGFDVASPSETINERFNFEEDPEDCADILIYDKEDNNGITINGKDAEKIIETLKEALFDLLIRKLRMVQFTAEE